MKVRNAAIADVDTIARFQLEMAGETEEKRLDAVVVGRGVRAVFGDHDRGRYVVAEQDGEVIGSLLLTWEWSDWRDGWFWWIQSVYVDPEHRRQGVFRKMYEYVARQGEARPDVRGIRLYVEDTNSQAQAVYSSLGMSHAGYQVFEVEFLA